MQVFASSSDPTVAAMNLDDKRLNKMITESAQIICTIFSADGVKDLPFKPTHASHPAVKWAGHSDENLHWLARHHTALIGEWFWRFNKTHASGLSADLLSHARYAKEPEKFHNGASNQLRELDYTWCENVHDAYRLYLTARWLGDTDKPKWTKHRMPLWFDWPFADPVLGYLLVNRVKSLLRINTKNIRCPRCGSSNFHIDSQLSFNCKETSPWLRCLSWHELK